MKSICRILCAVLLLSLVCTAAMASDKMYLIPDSDSRRLTENELWQWDRESLSFIFNEIFARHGYVFQPGGKYDIWFSSMPWYRPNANPDNQRYCYPKLSQLEWDNYHTIKRVAAEMDAYGYRGHDRTKKCYRNFTPPQNNFALSGFSYANLKSGQKLAVYSAPGGDSWRGANGKAQVITNGGVWAAGWEGNWLLIYYETNKGSIRVGYVDGSRIRGSGSAYQNLRFEYEPVTLTTNCTLTDDPMWSGTVMASLRAGQQVTYLSSFINQRGQNWDYVETTVGGQRARGFIPANSIDYQVDPLFDAEGGYSAPAASSVPATDSVPAYDGRLGDG